MRPRDVLRGAWLEIRAHRVRSALTCVSLAVGVAAALYTLSQVASIRRRFSDTIDLAGPGRIEVRRLYSRNRRGLSKGFTLDDVRALRAHFPELYMVSPRANAMSRIEADGLKAEQKNIYGITPEWRRREWVYRLEGRFLNQKDVDDCARVCVLTLPGHWIKKPFWAVYETTVDPYVSFIERRDMLGRWLTIDDKPFKVVGILHSPPPDLDPRWFNQYERSAILVPITTAHAILSGRSSSSELDDIQVDTGEEATAPAYTRKINAFFLSRHRGERDFEVKDYRDLIAGALKRSRDNILRVGIIGLVALLAGGIGVLNVTLANVYSRVREIGIRRALGATRRDIVVQFVAEALVLGTFAGAVGSALGAVVVIKFAANARMLHGFSPLQAVASTVISVGISFLFSVVPAWQASRLDPILALRYE